MTEKEAKTKWCPFARTLVTIENTINRSPQNAASANRFPGDAPGEEKGSMCLGSNCMAWRQTAVPEYEYSYSQAPPPGGGWEREYVSNVYTATSNAIPWRRKRTNTAQNSGYCGLAGKPE